MTDQQWREVSSQIWEAVQNERDEVRRTELVETWLSVLNAEFFIRENEGILDATPEA